MSALLPMPLASARVIDVTAVLRLLPLHRMVGHRLRHEAHAHPSAFMLLRTGVVHGPKAAQSGRFTSLPP
jgi:hypothetical protein